MRNIFLLLFLSSRIFTKTNGMKEVDGDPESKIVTLWQHTPVFPTFTRLKHFKFKVSLGYYLRVSAVVKRCHDRGNSDK